MIISRKHDARVITEAASTGRMSIASLSLGGEYSPSLNSAVDAAATSGVLMVVAAGNSAIDACGKKHIRCQLAEIC